MAFCLVKEKADEFLRKIKSGEININKLTDMTSEARQAEFIKVLGFDKETAKQVNALFESKLLLKYQKRGMINWIEKTAGLKPAIKRDLLSRVQRMEDILDVKTEKDFLSDIAEKRLGLGVTKEEAKKVFDMSKNIEESKKNYNLEKETWSSEKAKLEYGTGLVQFQNYVKDLKLKSQKLGIKDYLKKPQQIVYEIGGATKSFLATMDNSFYGRQGIKTLFTNPGIWAKNFLKSWADIGRVLKGKGYKKLNDGTFVIKSEIFSRPNAINGKYNDAKLDVGIDFEEAFPSSVPERIPVLGRLFQASESAFNGGAMRMRADLFDKYLKIAKKSGVDINNKEQLEGIGTLVNSTTGRGGLGKAEAMAKEINVLMFSAKFLKSNFDTLTAHLFDKKATPFAKKKAATNLLKIVGGMATILAISNAIDDDSVEFDPRSTDFGKIKAGNTRIDITGGMGSLITLASRITPTRHNGQWGFWSKSASTGKWTNLTAGEYGQRNAMNVFESFWEGKLAPITGLVRDVWKGQNYDQEKVNIYNAIKELTVPISAQQVWDLLKSGEKGEKILLYTILEGIGFSASTYKKDEEQIQKKVYNLTDPTISQEDFDAVLRVLGDFEIDENAAKTYLDQELEKKGSSEDTKEERINRLDERILGEYNLDEFLQNKTYNITEKGVDKDNAESFLEEYGIDTIKKAKTLLNQYYENNTVSMNQDRFDRLEQYFK